MMQNPSYPKFTARSSSEWGAPRYKRDIGNFSPKMALLLTAFLGFCLVPYGAAVLLVGLAVYASRGSRQSIEALSLTWLILFLNPGAFSINGLVLLLRWPVLFAAFFRTFLDFKKRGVGEAFPHCLKYALLFCVVVLMLSITSSQFPMVSSFKCIQFFIGISTIILGFRNTQKIKAHWNLWFLTLFTFIVFVSLPLYFSSLGFLRNGRGFQGILNHPQAYGVFLAPMVALITGKFIFNENRSLLTIGIILFSWFSLFATQARTAFLAVVGGFIFLLLVNLFIDGKHRKQFKYVFSSPLFVALFLFGSAFLVTNAGQLHGNVDDFLFKKNVQVEGVGASFMLSRGELILMSMVNFYENPIAGIGFGVPSDPSSFMVNYDRFLGLPIGAPVEKGFLPSAVVEEVGLLGSVVFVVFILSVFVPILRNQSQPVIWMALSCFLVNIGEMIIFSFGGNGLYIWLLLGSVIFFNETGQTKRLNENSSRYP